jgi:hypothetical protein
MSLTKATFSLIDGAPVNVLDYGADPTGAVDSAAAIQAAIDASSAAGQWLYVPAGTYNLIPNTVINDEDTTYVTKVCFIIKSNMQIWADPGAIFRIANNVSTDASPQSMGMFGTDTPKANVTIKNLTMDMNGANNLISPLRPTTYRRYNQSPILVSGQPASTVAYMDDVLIENCTFKNNPGVCDIVCAQSNSVGAALGRRWRIINNNFVNNGLDSDDHTAVFAWANDVEFSGNIVLNATTFATVGRTGGNTCYEVHGNRHRVTNNVFYNYIRGIWVSSNLTDTEAQDIVISDNTFLTQFYGVDFFRSVATLGIASNVVIANNTFRFDGSTFAAPVPDEKSAVNISSSYAQGNVLITGNTGVSTDTVVGATFLSVSTQSVAGQAHDNITLEGNKTTGFNKLAGINTTATNGMGYISISNNGYYNPLATPTFTLCIGVFVKPTTEIKSLKIDNNDFVDDRAVPLMDYGVYIEAGTIGALNYYPGLIKNVSTSPYIEIGTTVTNRQGQFDKLAYTPTWSSGTAITLGNGTLSGYYTLNGDQITINVKLTVGSTTTFPGGSLAASLPYTAGLSGTTFLGSWRIFDSSAGTFKQGVASVDGTASQVFLSVDGSTFASNTSPVSLATGDVVAAQITYSR